MEKQTRRNYFIDARFQGNFILKFCLFVVLATLAVTVIAINITGDSTTVTIEGTKISARHTADFIFPLLLQTALIVSVASSIVVAAVLLFETHKIAGPLYRIKKDLELLKNGDYSAKFKIRANDELKDLADELKGLSDHLEKKQALIKGKAFELKSAADSKNFGAMPVLLKDLEAII
jgi:methyl-accepting chemotaxis protein